jgi:Domain of unknown function (DUF1929)/Bacterial Ig domain
VASDNRVSRRHFLKILAAGATTIAFGSILGFSNLLSPTGKTARSGVGVSGIQHATAQSGPGNFVLGPNTGKISIHAATLTNGKVFYAAGSGFHSTYQLNGPFHWNTFDPNTGSITNHTVGKDIFCMGQAVLPNGKVLCAGGTLEYDVGDNPGGVWKGLNAAYEYDPGSNSLQEVQSMKHGRWYPYCIVLEDGKVLTIGGFDEWGSYNYLTEIYDPASKTWSIKYDPTSSFTYCVGSSNPTAPSGLPCYGGAGNGVAPVTIQLYPRAIFMPSGLVAVAGQSSTTRTWNPQTGAWVNGGKLSVARSYGNMVLLPLNNDPAEKGQLLVCGGSSSAATNATTVVELLTPTSASNYTKFSFQTIASCNFGRRHAPNAYLPDGKIVFFGGTNFQNSSAGAYLNAEIFDPVAKSWTVVNGMNVPKIYHCTGILLLDGRVWLAGSQYSKSNWELRSEFYVPSYYNAARPTISSDPTVGGYGGTINIPTSDAADIQKVSLIALSTFTHGFNSQMRFIWLQIQSKGSSSVTVSAPVNAKIAPPGYYMIHVLNSSGVPSIAKVIKIPGTASPPPGDTTPPTIGISSPSDGATISGPSSGVTVAVTGTASDGSGGSGIQKVEVKVGSNPFKLATATGPGGSGDWSTWSASDVVTSSGNTTILARATDNAGNIKDSTITVTVAFSGGGGGGTYTTIYSQAGTTSYIPLNTGSNHRAGEIMTSASVLIGNSIKKLTVKLKKAGNPTGTITVLVRNGTGDSPAITFGTIEASTLTTADQTFTLESPTSHTFAANDKVLVEWAGTGTSTDQVLVKRHAYADPAASFDGINTKQAHKVATSTGYSSYNNADIAGEWSKLE